MRKTYALAAAAAAMIFAPHAPACEVVDATFEKKVAESPETREAFHNRLLRDFRQLRVAAKKLHQLGFDDSCESIMAAIQRMRDDPKEVRMHMVRNTPKEELDLNFYERQKLAMSKAKPLAGVGRFHTSDVLGAEVFGASGKSAGEVNDIIVSADEKKASGALRPKYEAETFDFEATVPIFAGDLCFKDHCLGDKSNREIFQIIAQCEIDHTLPPSEKFAPTVNAATAALGAFVEQFLETYAARRINPADEDGVSRLSPYLNFGLIGTRIITKAVRDANAPANAKWKYLDELLTWREYFHYLAFHNDTPDSFQNVPHKPRQSLLEHAHDERPVLFSLSDLLHGRTDDETWNAAQRQWLQTGYMHNNLRMYWGKQIIKWTRDPETAWKTACYLNDRLALDDRDPATYGNMQWVFGRSRPSWKEQPIYGCVPPKTDRAIRKREGASDWLTKWAETPTDDVDVPAGLPHDLL